jgi:hypothetical protein
MPLRRPDAPVLQQHRGQWAIVFWDGVGVRRRVATGTADERRARQALAEFKAKLDADPAATGGRPKTQVRRGRWGSRGDVE